LIKIKLKVDFWPKEAGGRCTFDGNYRKAAVWLWYHEWSNNYFPGFFNNYFWKVAPMWWVTLMVADTFGIFTYWRVDMMSGPGTNSWEDSFS
jgi:solute carrier family 25 oxoglutarate transporter 11